jgi:hypothetical protein
MEVTMQNTEPTDTHQELISKFKKHLPNSAAAFPNFVTFTYGAHMLIKEVEKLLSVNEEDGSELDLEEIKLLVLRTRQCLDRAAPDLQQFHYSDQK